MSIFKAGANKRAQFKIKQLAAKGMTAEEISVGLRIALAPVKAFMPPKPKAKPAPPADDSGEEITFKKGAAKKE